MLWLAQLKHRLLGSSRTVTARRLPLDLRLEVLEDRVMPALTAVPLPPGLPATVVVNAFVNDQGQIAGTAGASSGSAGATNGFVWSAALGTQTIFPGGQVLAENNAGQVLGTTKAGALELWSAQTGLTAIPLPSATGSVLNAVLNNQGQVAGTAYSSGSGSGLSSSSGAGTNGFVWTAALGTQKIFPGSVLAENNAGQVLGTGQDPLDLWSATNGTTAIPLPSGSSYVLNAYLNNQGQVAGTAASSGSANSNSAASSASAASGGTNGFVWTAAVGTQTVFAGGAVYGQNNNGTLIGAGTDALDLRDASGAITNVPLPLQQTFVSGGFINNQGQVAANTNSGSSSGPGSNGFIWTEASGTQTIFAGGHIDAENNAGQVLGTTSTGTLELWDPKNGATAIPLPAGTSLENVFLNDQGQVAGTTTTSFGYFAVKHSSVGSNSGSLSGSSGSLSSGSGGASGGTNGFVWTAALGTQTILPGGQVDAENNAGQVLGTTSTGGLTLWNPNGSTTAIPLPAGMVLVNVYLNNQGQVTGTLAAASVGGSSSGSSSSAGSSGSGGSGGWGGFFWTARVSSAPTETPVHSVPGGTVPTTGSLPLPILPPLPIPIGSPGGGTGSSGSGSSSSVGSIGSSGGSSGLTGTSGFVWTSALGTQTVFAGGSVLGENDAGEVLGLSSTGSLGLWDPKSGATTTIPLPSGQVLSLNGYLGISDEGQVVGNTYASGSSSASSGATTNGFVWTASLGTQALPGDTVLGQNDLGQVLVTASDGSLDVWTAGALGTVPSAGGGKSIGAGQTHSTPAANVITFNALPNQTYGVAPITLVATASSDLPVSYEVVSGPATLSGDVLTITGAGKVTIAATQTGNSSFATAHPVEQSFEVEKAALTVTAEPASLVYGQPDTGFTYEITGFVDGQTLATSGVTGAPGLHTSATPNSPVGQYAIVVDQGSLSAANYAFSNLDNGTLTVTPDGTSTQLQASVNPVATNATVRLSATVTAFPGSAVPHGSVTFFDGATEIGSAPLVNGSASLPVTLTTVGTQTLTADFSGNADFTASDSAGLTEQVVQPGTTTTLTLNHAASVYGQAVTLKATVAPAGRGHADLTGTVRFYDGTTLLGTASVKAGTATLSTSTLGLGTHALTAVYGDDPVFATSTSTSVTATVNPATAHVKLTVSGGTALGATITLTANVSASAPSTSAPVGSVTFLDGTTALATVALTDGSASMTISSLNAGKHSLTAVFTGANFSASTSPVVHTTIRQPANAPQIDAVPATVTLSANVASTVPGAAPLTGSVTFLDGKHELGTATVIDGTATLTVTLPSGKPKLSAVYHAADTLAGVSVPVIEVAD